MSNPILCIGGAAIDRKYRLIADLSKGSSNPATLSLTHGGVARNVAETLARLGADVFFVSRVGRDAEGTALIAALAGLGVDISGTSIDDELPSADYAAVLDKSGDLVMGLAAMDILQAIAVPADGVLRAAGWVLADCNLSAGVLRALIGACNRLGVPLAVDAVSTAKVQRLPQRLDGVACLFLNLDEAAALTGLGVAAREDGARAQQALQERGCASSIVSAGAAGLSVFSEGAAILLDAPQVRVIEVTGAGDALIAGTLFGLNAQRPLPRAVRIGIALAARTVASSASVCADLSPDLGQRLLQDLETAKA